jgi:hypothetical protein
MKRIDKNAKGWTRVGERAVLDAKALGIFQLAMEMVTREYGPGVTRNAYSVDLAADGGGGTVGLYEKEDPLKTAGGSEFPPND